MDEEDWNGNGSAKLVEHGASGWDKQRNMQHVQTRGMVLRVARCWWLGKGEKILERKGREN